jgi:hypothetical protein
LEGREILCKFLNFFLLLNKNCLIFSVRDAKI